MAGDTIMDLEITVRMTIPGAVSYADLEEYYESDPLRCAKELVETGGLMGATSEEFEITSAAMKSPALRRSK
jgi:hypothetical protein